MWKMVLQNLGFYSGTLYIGNSLSGDYVESRCLYHITFIG